MVVLFITNLFFIVISLVLCFLYAKKVKEYDKLDFEYGKTIALSDKLQEKIIEYKKEIWELRNKITQFENSCSKLHNEIDSLNTMIDDYIKEIKRMDSLIADLKEKVNDYLKELSNFPMRDIKTGQYKKRM